MCKHFDFTIPLAGTYPEEVSVRTDVGVPCRIARDIKKWQGNILTVGRQQTGGEQVIAGSALGSDTETVLRGVVT